MRPSSHSDTFNRPWARTWLVSLALLGTLACEGQTQPAPKKVDRQTEFDRPGTQPKPKPDPNSPFSDPAVTPPRGREGAQLDKAGIDAALAEAAKHASVANVIEQRIALGKCANKIPASARCDGELGVSLANVKNRRAVARYYLAEAAKTDDPDASGDLYARVAEAARKHGMIAEALAAQEKAVARDPSPANQFALGRLLTLDPQRLPEAAEWMAKARATDDQLAWHYEEAVIRGQIFVKEEAQRAADLLDSYVARVEALPEGDPNKIDVAPLKVRIAELRDLAKSYPTAAEAEAKRKEAEAAATNPAPAPAPADPSAPAQPVEPVGPTPSIEPQ